MEKTAAVNVRSGIAAREMAKGVMESYSVIKPREKTVNWRELLQEVRRQWAEAELDSPGRGKYGR